MSFHWISRTSTAARNEIKLSYDKFVASGATIISTMCFRFCSLFRVCFSGRSLRLILATDESRRHPAVGSQMWILLRYQNTRRHCRLSIFSHLHCVCALKRKKKAQIHFTSKQTVRRHQQWIKLNKKQKERRKKRICDFSTVGEHWMNYGDGMREVTWEFK